MRTIGTTNPSGPAINMKITRDSINTMVAFGACEFKISWHGASSKICKATDNVRVEACLDMPRSMLLERAVSTDQAQPRCKLGRLKVLNREPMWGALVSKWAT